MKINLINHIKSVYRASKPIRTITPIGYEEGYFMKKSPLAKDYVAPSRMTKICQSVRKFFSGFFNN